MTFRALGRNHIAYEPSHGLSRCFVLIRQSDSPGPCRFRVRRWSQADRVRRRTLLGRCGFALDGTRRRSGNCTHVPGDRMDAKALVRSLDRTRRRTARYAIPHRTPKHRDGPRSATLPLDVPTLSRVRQLLVPAKAVASLPRVVPSRSDVTEPILVPKLRIHLADFPYLHSARPRGCSPWRPDAEIGTHWHGSLAPFARVFTVRPPIEKPRRIHGALAFSRRARFPASARSDSWDRWGVSQNR